MIVDILVSLFGAEAVNLVKRAIKRVFGRKKPKTDTGKDTGRHPTPLPQEKISISKLPTTGTELFGRERELELLDAAWQEGRWHVVTLVAWGGVGKSALVNEWLGSMAAKDWCGAEKVYGWSFYSQDAKEGTQASADEFFQETLAWFGDPDPKAGSAAERGKRLANLVRGQRTLLILDGMEPLQYPPHELKGFAGQLKDPGLKVLLRELAASQPGLCVVTTREQVSDLANWTTSTVREECLEHLSDEAGVQLLNHLDVKGRAEDILAAVNEYRGHALALTLLGNFITVVHEGDIRKRDLIPDITEDEEKGGHARRVMASYEKWLKGSPELDILYIMGLFDRPAPMGAIDTLRKEPAIAGVTDTLQGLTDTKWRYCLKRLRGRGLLAREETQKGEAHTLDCHPLIREHFGQRLQKENPDGWKDAHTRLYNYFKDLPEKRFPDTLEEMEPLFAAVAHGCKAGLHQKTKDEIYEKRIRRYKDNYCCKQLGSFGSDLATLSHFFDTPWTQPAKGLTDEAKAAVLNWAGFRLRALGRLHEAVQPMEAALKAHIKQENWIESARDTSNLSELLLCLGEVKDAVEAARKSVAYADKSGDAFQREGRRTNLAVALHHNGKLEEAEKWFREAEPIQKKWNPDYPYIYSTWGYRFCDFLLGQGDYLEVIKRAELTLEWGKKDGILLDIALDNLSMGRAHLMCALGEKTGDFSKARGYLDRAVAGLREAGTQHMLPLALFARCDYFRITKEYDRAWPGLEEAREIADLGGMRLFLADYHLEAGKLCRAEGKESEAREHFIKAKEMMEEMGYGRKLKEVNEALRD